MKSVLVIYHDARSKARRQCRRFIAVLILCLLFVSPFTSNAEENGINSVTPPTTNTKLRFVNLAHTGYSGDPNDPLLVLNIYGSTPSVGNKVTTYTWSNNNTQWWRNIYLGNKDPNDSETKYYKLEVFSDNTLTLYYDPDNTKSIIFPPYSMYFQYYELKWLVGNHNALAYRIKLYSQARLLGVTNATIGTQCYWYTFANNDLSNATTEENWLFYTVT